LIEPAYDDITEETLKEARDLIKGIREFLSGEEPGVPLKGLGRLFLMLTTLLVEVGQYRHETARKYLDISREIRAEVVDALGAWMRRPELEGLRVLLMENLMPLFKLAVDAYFPYRVNFICASVDRLFEIGVLLPRSKIHELIDYVVDRKYPKFGTSGIRGVWGKDFKRRRIMYIVHAICDLADAMGVKDKVFVIGYDSRRHADEVAKWAAGVCLARGYKVLIAARETPTPALVFYSRNKLQGRIAGLLVATASHNPVEWQGIKYYPPSCFPAPTNMTNWIGSRANLLQLMSEGEPAYVEVGGTSAPGVAYFDPMEDYINYVKSRLKIDEMRAYFSDKIVVVDEMLHQGDIKCGRM